MSAKPAEQEGKQKGYGTVTEPGTVRIERLLPGPIERVWAYLTESEKRGKWLASGGMELRVGGRVELKFRHADLSHEKTYPEKYKHMEKGATFHAQITRCEPPRLLSYTWAGQSFGESEVSFELTPRGNDVLLVLTHHKIASRQDMVSFASGWHTHLGILIDNLKGVDPRGFWSTHMRLAEEYKKRLPVEKKTGDEAVEREKPS
jgi:uncharacterized protein YndB with AHSA1/START domain